MPIPSVTYTFSDGTTAYGSQVQQDFADLIACLTDGTKDLTINSLTTTGAVTIGGATTLGNAASDSITWNGTAPSILLDNAATDGGAVYFNAGTSSFLKSSADGTTIGYGAFKNGVQGWVKFTGTGTPTAVASHNVASITDNGTGDYTVNWTTAFSDANYCVVAVCSSAQTTIGTQAAGSVQVLTTGSTGTPVDAANVWLIAVGAR